MSRSSSRNTDSTPPPAPFIGRREILDRLLRRIDRGRDYEGQFLPIVGRSGVGKSVLLDTAVEHARELGFEVLLGRAPPSDLPEPFRLLRDLLHSFPVVQEDRGRGGSQKAGPLPLFLAPYEMESTPIAERFDSAHSDANGGADLDALLSALVAPPTERSDANRSAALAQVARFLLEGSSRTPLLLAIDDLHFADDSSAQFLQELLPQLGAHRIIVLATTLPADEAPPRSAETIRSLLGQHTGSVLTVRPLTEPEVRDFVRYIQRGRDPEPGDVMRWFTQTEGNPQFIHHLVRASLGFPAAHAAVAEQGYDEFVRSQVQALPEGDRRLLVYASVFGKEFQFPIVAQAAGAEEERLSESLDRLVRLGLIREKGGELYEFSSERVRADVYADLTDTRRRILHRHAARALEQQGTTQPHAIYELARHFYLAQDYPKSVEFNHRAADLAALSYAYQTAIVYAERALDCARRLPTRDRTQEQRISIELGRYLNEVGDLQRSESVLEETVRDLKQSSDRPVDVALCVLGLAQTKSDLTKYAEAKSLAQEASGMLEQLGHRRGIMAAHRVLGVAMWRQGDLPGAETHHRAELELAREIGTPLELGHALIDLANTLSPAVNQPEGLALYNEAERIFARQSDASAHARVLMNRALLHYAAGRLEEALRDITQSVEAAERSQSRIWLGYSLLNLAQIRCDARDLLGANQAIDRAQGLLESLGDPLAAQQTTMIRGMILEGEHKYEDAERLFAQALDQARSAALEPQEAEMLFRLAQLAERRGHRALAGQILDDKTQARIAALRPDLAGVMAQLTARLGDPTLRRS
jgi:tetratricopeptide (TPR) repeat protein